jgi:RNA polymerase sigma-70 factor (ECF subfamily)
VQAAINAVHCDAPSVERTDWGQILALYDLLYELTPTPVVALNRAVAVAEVRGPAAALALVEPLPLDDFYLWHAVRGDLLGRLGETGAARDAFIRASALSENAAQRRFLSGRAETPVPLPPV